VAVEEAVAMSGAVGGPSLDLGKNNSTRPEAAENGQYEQSDLGEFVERNDSSRYDCRGVYSNFRYESESGKTAEYRCDSWDCYCCGYRMRNNLVEEIDRVTSERPELRRFLTLTLDDAKAPASQERQHHYLTERWNALRTAIEREYGDFSYIWVREEQDSGRPHLHILVSRYIPQEWVSRRWSELGGGEVVDIRQVDTRKAAHYVGKYLTKSATSGFPDGIRRYGSSRDIDLDVRGGGGDSVEEWRLLMDDHEVDREGEPLTRAVSSVDFVVQRLNRGPLGKGPPS
jgi:hypothetical protein